MEVKIIEINASNVTEAKELVLQGLKERFGFLDTSLNPDLEDILEYYGRDGCTFLIGLNDNKVICTGAVSKENKVTGRVERMSVRATFRGLGFARLMLSQLETSAREIGYSELVLETNNTWISAINLYETSGYIKYLDDGEYSHFKKSLFTQNDVYQ